MTDRLTTAMEAIVNAILPALAAHLQWEYRVTSVDPGPPVLISGEPVETSGQFACPYGSLANIALWPGPDGGYAIPKSGTIVLLAFNNGNPAKPRIAGLDPNAVPTLTTLAGGGPAIARVGDSVKVTGVQAGLATVTATIVSGSTKAVCG